MISVGRVALEEQPLLDTVAFVLSNGRRFELLVSQDTVCVEEIRERANWIASFDLEPGERLTLGSFDASSVEVPFIIGSVAETRAGEGERQFTVGLRIWNIERQPVVSICTESDEAEIMEPGQFGRRLDQMPFDYKTVIHKLYAAK